MKPIAWRVSASALLTLAWVSVCAGLALGQTADLVDRSALRVCADPANLPFSDRSRKGFENKIADLLGAKLDLPVLYTWFPQATGFIRNTLGAKKCDLVIGYAQGHELVQNTNHYYRSAYVFVVKSDSDLADVKNLDDGRLKDKRIGVIAGTPPATIMAMNGLIGNAKPYHLVVDRRYSAPGEEMVADIVSGEIAGGLLWGPIGGYYAKSNGAELKVIPLTSESKGPRMVYRITMGVRRQERDWKRQLNKLLRAHHAEINEILLEFGVPLLDEQDELLTQASE
jgi:quinoprotein dehydrogenase-associated probable ABC transporter substrate-binding protein